MRILKRFVFLWLFFSVLYGCKGGEKQAVISNETAAQVKSDKFTLKNGLTVVSRYIAQSPMVSLELLVKSGSADESGYLGTGISHFIEHMIFKGTEKYKAGDLAREIKRLGGELNGFTNYDCTAFVITVPKENFEKALGIIIESAYAPSFDAGEFNKEREVILNEMRLNEDDPQRKIHRLFWLNFYTRHPYRHPVIGYPELLSKLTVDDLKSYHGKHFVPNNMILSLAGNFDRENLFKTIEEKFWGLERGKETENINIVEPALISVRHYEESFPTKLMYLMLGFSGVEISHEDLFALDLLATILGEGESSRLNNKLKQKENLVYSIFCFNHTPKDRGVFGIFLSAEYKNKNKIIQKIMHELNEIKQHAVSSRELDKAKNIVLSRFHYEHETVENQAQELAANEFLTAEPDFNVSYIDRIKNITSQDLLSAARKYLKIENFVTVSLRPRDTGQPTEEKPQENPAESEIKKIKLPNGMTLLLKEEHRLPIVTIGMSFLGGLRLENKENNGLSNLCAALLTKGTRHKTAEQISAIIEERGGELGTFSGNNSLGLSLSLLSKDINLGIKILSEIVRFANFPAKELEKNKIQTIAKIKTIADDPFSYAFKLLKKNLYLSHPYGMDSLGEIDTVEKLSAKDIREFYRTTILPENCVMAVWGDFDTGKIVNQVKSGFSWWIPRNKFQNRQIPNESPISLPRIYSEKTDKKQAILVLGFHTVSLHDPQRYALELLNAIINGQGNRLFERIREQLGLAYVVGAYHVLGIDPGYFVYYVATDKENLARAKTTLLKEIDNLQAEEFSDAEIERAKAYLVAEEKRNLQTNSAFALHSSLDELYGLGFDNYKKFEHKINTVTKEDLKAAARKYFNPDSFCLVEIIPE